MLAPLNLHAVGLQEIETFSSGTNYYVLVESQDRTSHPFTALVFRGTCGFEGWLPNLKAIQTGWSGVG